jgi:lysophospholipase L1-like esterase
MAINPANITTISVGELPSSIWNLTDKLPHEVAGALKSGDVQGLADLISDFIGTASSLAFNPTTVLDGETLPATSSNEWVLVGKGTFGNVGGALSITTTEELNAITSNGTYWTLSVQIPINVELAGIVQTIRSSFTTTTPSENAVFNALALKLDSGGYGGTGQDLANDLTDVLSSINELPGIFNTVVYEGDSITAYTTGVSYGTTNYPTQIVNYNSEIAKAQQVNVATSGQRLATFISNGDYVTQIQPYKPTSNKEKVLLCLMIGCNDVGDGTAVATVYANLKTVWAQAKADGFTVIAFGITRSTIALRDSGALALNALIYSDPTLYDYAIKTEVILPNPADLTYFNADGIHLNENGSKKLAKELNNVLINQVNGYNSNEVALSVINGKTDFGITSATSFIKKGATSTDALLAGGGTLPFPIGAGGTGVANYIPMYNAPGFIGLSKLAHSGDLSILYIDSKATVGLSPSYANPVGQFNIKTGATLSYNLAGQDMGSFSFGNASGSANIPTMIGKSTDNRGLFLIAASPDTNAASDFEFNIRRNTDADYTTLTGGGFRFARQNNQLMFLSRAGVLNLTNLAGTGIRQIVADASGNLSAGSVQPLKYVALVSQGGTSAPTATVLENSLHGIVVWTRQSTGIYLATLSGAFTASKTIVTYGNSVIDTMITGYSNTVNTVAISTSTALNVLKDGALSSATIKIEVYP